MPQRSFRVGSVTIGGEALTLIGGPCVIESEALCLEVGTRLRDACARVGFGYIFKASFDKANRTSVHAFRGPGIEAG